MEEKNEVTQVEQVEQEEVAKEEKTEAKSLNISLTTNNIGIFASAIALGILVLLKIICGFAANRIVIGVFNIFILIFASAGLVFNYIFAKKSTEMWLSVIMLAIAILSSGF